MSSSSNAFMPAAETHYKITVEKVTTTSVPSRDWKKVREPFPNEDTAFRSQEERERDPQFAYVPCLRTNETKVTLLEQTVEDLDLVKVIKAVNSID